VKLEHMTTQNLKRDRLQEMYVLL